MDISGRFEWLTIPAENEPSDTSAGPGPAIAYPAKSCPECGWIDGDQRFEDLAGQTGHRECWRCGAKWGISDEIKTFFADEDITFPPVLVAHGKNNWKRFFRSDAHMPVRAFDLHLEVAGLCLRKGYHELMSLSVATIDHFPHQIRTARTVLQKMRGRAIIADEVGLGKTIEAALVIKELILRSLAQTVLILAPAALTLQWQEELRNKFGEEFKLLQGHHTGDDAPQLVCSYDTAKRRPGLLDRTWDILVLDEAHRLKNRKTALSRFVRKIQSHHTLGLTATPVENSFSELHNLVDIVCPGKMGTLRTFRRNFVDAAHPHTIKKESQGALRSMLSDVMIRNRRDSCGLRLPKRRAGIYYLIPSEDEKSLYTQITRFVKTEFRKISRESTSRRIRMLNLIILQRELMSSPRAVSTTLMKMSHRKQYPVDIQRRLQGFAEMAMAIDHPVKLKALEEILERYPNKRFLIFTEFVTSMHAITSFLSDLGITVFNLYGQLSFPQRAAAIHRFRNTSSSVMVSTEAGGTGLNLQCCHHLVNFDLPWNPMKIEQRIGRIDRIGQKEETIVINLVCQETIEEHVVEILAHKLKMFEMVVGETGMVLGHMRQGKSFEQLVAEIWLESETEEDQKTAFAKLGAGIEASREAYDKSCRTNRQLDFIGNTP